MQCVVFPRQKGNKSFSIIRWENVGWKASSRLQCRTSGQSYSQFIPVLFLYHRGSWGDCVSQVSHDTGWAQHPYLFCGQHISSCDQHHMVEQWAFSHRRCFRDQLHLQEWSFLLQDQLPHLPPFCWWCLWLQSGALGPGQATSETLGYVWVLPVLGNFFSCQVRASF